MTPVVSLCDVDPDLTAGVPDDDHALARRVLAGPRYDLPKGRWAPCDAESGSQALAQAIRKQYLRNR